MSETQSKIVEDASKAKNKTGRRYTALLAVLTMCIFFMTGYVAYNIYNMFKNQADSATQLAQEVRDLCAVANPEELDTLGDLCPKADKVVESAPNSVEVPSPSPGRPGEPGEPGPQGEQGPPGPGPTSEQVSRAVSMYCANNKCRGPAPSATVIAAAVSTYCNNRNECVGDEGVKGEQGITGEKGEQGPQGIQGPPPSAEQIKSAVNTYCSNHNNCQGPKGEQGPTGVVQTETVGCESRGGFQIDSIDTEYLPETKTIRVTCVQIESPTFPPNLPNA